MNTAIPRKIPICRPLRLQRSLIKYSVNCIGTHQDPTIHIRASDKTRRYRTLTHYN